MAFALIFSAPLEIAQPWLGYVLMAIDVLL
ncbi:MAG: hypothetical protein UX72_C0001G0119 [Parcubacteria group bacterium GW2011_GWA2_47_10]|nr:MAG: hypothetical protein UX72_C0001G0119 [Parcubacteria group bacterium GW2011_GWA2_47_10]